MMNTIKYKGELLAENSALLVKTPGVLGEYKELRADALEADTLDITIVSESGTIRNFALNDKVEYFRSGVRRGVYYLQSVTRTGPNLYTLSALSAVGRLIARTHRGGIYTGQTVAEVVAVICGKIPVLVETIYKDIRLYGWLPSATARDNLVQVLFAVGAWLHTDENGVLRVQKLWNGTSGVIGASRVHAANIQVKYSDPVSAVAVTEHQYVPGTDDIKLFSGTAQQGDSIEFDEPAHSLTAEGFTILESGANYAILSAGSGTLTGKRYDHNMRIVTRTVIENAPENVVEISDATLVSAVNAADVAQRMADYYACREQLIVDVNPAGEHAGHVVSIWDEWDKQLTLACIASRETKISGLLKSRTTALVGYLPPQPEASEYYDERVVLTGSGTWTPPAGVTSVRVTAIGGGQGGKCGAKGEDGKPSRSMSWTTAGGNWSGYGYTEPSAGGAGGEPGQGGKVYTDELSIETGAPVSYSCGTGGLGAEYSDEPAEGSLGTSTVFGSISSAAGASSDAGYYDALGGVTYGARGLTGIPGGDSGGSSSVQDYPHPNPDVVGYFQLGLGVLPAQSVTDEDGTAYIGGSWLVDSTEKIQGVGASGKEYACSAPGGAAAGAAGESGKLTGGSITEKEVIAPNGANGASATLTPKKPATYGQGGRGGYGGGAGGCPGYGGKNTTTAAAAALTAGTPGIGGVGSKGGPGADGCIILYYRRPRLVQGGWAKDKNGKLLLEHLNKRLIV